MQIHADQDPGRTMPPQKDEFYMKYNVWKSGLFANYSVTDPGSGAFLTPGPGSGIRNRFFLDPGSGSRIPYPKPIFLRG